MKKTILLFLAVVTASEAFVPLQPLRPATASIRGVALGGGLQWAPTSSASIDSRRFLSSVAEPEDSGKLSPWKKFKNAIPTGEERQKLVPLALMFFCILFNYTILRDTKDVLMVTAPKSGAEVIPFIKTYFNLPVAIVSRISGVEALFFWREEGRTHHQHPYR